MTRDAAIWSLASLLIGWGANECRHWWRHRAPPLRPPVIVSHYERDPETQRLTERESTYILGGRVPQEPT